MSSKKTQRRSRYEKELFQTALAVIFRAQTMAELELLASSMLLEDPRYVRLPAFRRARLDAYFQGALDALARVYVQPAQDPSPGRGLRVVGQPVVQDLPSQSDRLS